MSVVEAGAPHGLAKDDALATQGNDAVVAGRVVVLEVDDDAPEVLVVDPVERQPGGTGAGRRVAGRAVLRRDQQRTASGRLKACSTCAASASAFAGLPSVGR